MLRHDSAEQASLFCSRCLKHCKISIWLFWNSWTTWLKGIDKFNNLEFPPYMTYGACTTISVYENLSKNSFFICARKPTPPYSRSRSRFASAKVRLFRKPAKKHERKFKKIAKNGCKRDNKETEKGRYTLLILYIERLSPSPSAREGSGYNWEGYGEVY